LTWHPLVTRLDDRRNSPRFLSQRVLEGQKSITVVRRDGRTERKKERLGQHEKKMAVAGVTEEGGQDSQHSRKAPKKVKWLKVGGSEGNRKKGIDL